MSYHTLYTLCKERRSVRSFSPEPVPAELIQKILDIAATSPYASGRKNWSVLVIDDKTLIEKMAQTVQTAAAALKKTIRDDLQEDFAHYAEHFTLFRTAPVLLVPVFRIGKTFTYMTAGSQTTTFNPAQWERDNYTKSISCVCMQILLAAHSLNLVSCYMTGPLIAEPQLAPLLNLKKEQTIAALLPLGRSDLK